MKIAKEVQAALKQFADRLPSTEQVERAPRLGSELMKAYGDKLGQLNPNQRYYIGDASCAVNHLKRLTRAFESGGMSAVIEYLRPYEAFLGTPDTDSADEQPRASEGFPEGRLELGEAESAI